MGIDENQKIMYSMKEMQEALGIGKTLAYQLVATRNFPKVIINNRYYIPCDELRKWVSKNLGKHVSTA